MTLEEAIKMGLPSTEPLKSSVTEPLEYEAIDYKSLLEPYLSEEAKLILLNSVDMYDQSTEVDNDNKPCLRVMDDNGDLLTVRYFANISIAEKSAINDKAIKRFADNINQLVEEGLIEYGCLAPVFKMKMAIVDVNQRWIVAFYPCSSKPFSVLKDFVYDRNRPTSIFNTPNIEQ